MEIAEKIALLEKQLEDRKSLLQTCCGLDKDIVLKSIRKAEHKLKKAKDEAKKVAKDDEPELIVP